MAARLVLVISLLNLSFLIFEVIFNVVGVAIR